MGIYEPLTRHLESLPENNWSTNFTEIERILSRKLPVSAYDYRPWWGNQKKGNHSQAKAWREAGWETREVDLKHKTVRFERVQRKTSPKEGVDRNQLDVLYVRAQELSGIQDRSELLKAALNALIQRETAKYVASLGGTMPDAEAAPRRRFTW